MTLSWAVSLLAPSRHVQACHLDLTIQRSTRDRLVSLLVTARKRSCGKVMFFRSVCLSTGGLCPGDLCRGGESLSGGSLSRGSLSGGDLCPGVSVLGDLCPGGLCRGGLCPGGLCRGVSVTVTPSPVTVEELMVHILLECILVCSCFHIFVEHRSDFCWMCFPEMRERVDEADRPASTGPGADGSRERAHVQRLRHAPRSVTSKWPQKGSIFHFKDHLISNCCLTQTNGRSLCLGVSVPVSLSRSSPSGKPLVW